MELKEIGNEEVANALVWWYCVSRRPKLEKVKVKLSL
jgi:hypothetical protein